MIDFILFGAFVCISALVFLLVGMYIRHKECESSTTNCDNITIEQTPLNSCTSFSVSEDETEILFDNEYIFTKIKTSDIVGLSYQKPLVLYDTLVKTKYKHVWVDTNSSDGSNFKLCDVNFEILLKNNILLSMRLPPNEFLTLDGFIKSKIGEL